MQIAREELIGTDGSKVRLRLVTVLLRRIRPLFDRPRALAVPEHPPATSALRRPFTRPAVASGSAPGVRYRRWAPRLSGGGLRAGGSRVLQCVVERPPLTPRGGHNCGLSAAGVGGLWPLRLRDTRIREE